MCKYLVPFVLELLEKHTSHAHRLTYSMPATFVNASSNIEIKCLLREHVEDSKDVSGETSKAASDALAAKRVCTTTTPRRSR